jgi:hypothetical protein
MTQSEVSFQSVGLTTPVDQTREIEYQAWVLLCDFQLPASLGTTSYNATVVGVPCKIIRKRSE